ncbi:ferritin-like domain-containing protein [Streptomyces sp. NBC_00440]|uniref:ferritin-like domain-containing protein n=1 Tax=unclassified Streptomyces TaxID=2593676 RepID=UPI0022564AAF|nr:MULTISPECIES: ferritin-like domain-containing protein [unclassified Streptomyces]MCX4725108.1 ferritin-like domain-containing protein [Streptomyces sp. NBC_01306]WSX68429.1 ferritin-like domain-containing protein [Streptomyces sp. NBC_00932]
MSSTKGSWELPISEGELSRLTSEMDEAHRATLPVMAASARDLSAELKDLGTSGPDPVQEERSHLARRRFLTGAGASAAMLALAACGGKTSTTPTGAGASASTSASASASSSGGASKYTGDLKVVALSVALENQAVAAYQAALKAANAGKLGKVPPAIATFIQTAMAQHKDHADAWNGVLSSAGKPKITDVPLSDQPAVTKALGQVKDVTGVAKLALQLEDQATETYVFATYNVKSLGGVNTAATIAPVEAMHAAILHYVLGQYPVPDAFIGTKKAASPSLLTV